MTYCVFCGGALADHAHCASCGAVNIGGTWHPGGPAEVTVAADGTGWRPDPTGRHEGRYYVGGQPTDLVRDGGTESLDAAGKQQLDHLDGDFVAEAPPETRRKARIGWIAAAVVLAVVLVGGGLAAYVYLTRDRTTVDDEYLTALRVEGYSGEFNSDANAVAHGKQVCRKLDEGNPQQGMPADAVAVQYFCPQFAEGFHVLETTTITGSFTLKDDETSAYSSAIDVDGSSCTGAGGYSDVSAGTPVTVKNGKGEILTTSYLEPGRGGRYLCTFGIAFEVTEGQDRYVVSVGRRGELSFTFEELKARGVALVLE
ncbi:DUF732 domain-containing protein [Mycolicibacterium vaccae]|uniref:DUF732 domain-containing protein n=1 Tax=Mycolicibacterium vaccae TaxID=1810 RepID=UPI003CE70290